ncbi:hypothetical protein GGS20DRAFT_589911 [Poronia punctata]|nr:hypothetical protein GGS20DRAFT_589911 [Poronia punctata]
MARSSNAGRTPKLEEIVVLFGGFCDTRINIDNLRTNSSYIYKPARNSPKWKVALANMGIRATSTIFCLTCTQPPKDRRAWVFGSASDEGATDFWLHVDNSTGMSRRHFSIGFGKNNISLVPEIQCLSKSGLIIEMDEKQKKLSPEESCTISTPVRVFLDEVQTFWLWCPDRTPRQERIFRINVDAFARVLNTEPPLYIPSIKSGISTLVGPLNSNSRRGREGAVYRREPGYTYSSGGTASTFRVQKEGMQALDLIAKEPHYKNQHEIAAFATAEALENEFKALTRFQHPHVMIAYDIARPLFGVSAVRPPWLILENLPYELFDVPQNDPVGLTVDILSGVQAIHLAGYIHRDVKPDNIRAYRQRLSNGSNRWVLKICDAGSATLQTTADKGFAGTLNYIAPEIWQDSHRYDESVDVFSLAIIVLMFFTSYTQWQHATKRLVSYDDVVLWIVDEAMFLVEEAPESYRPLLYGMLALEPQDRWDTQRCMNYLSCLSAVSCLVCGGDKEQDVNKAKRKRTKGSLLEDDTNNSESDDARTVRPRLSPIIEVNTPAASTLSYDGTFYTAPVIQSGGAAGGTRSSISEDAIKGDSLCDTASWGTVGACSRRPPSMSVPDHSCSLPHACEEGRPAWVDNPPRADWERRLEEGSLKLPTGYSTRLVCDDDEYPQSVPVTPRLDDEEVMGGARTPMPEDQAYKAGVYDDENRGLYVELHKRIVGGRVFEYKAPRRCR